MNDQNINSNQVTSDTKNADFAEESIKKTGLNEWNDRLENNLEPESNGDQSADERAEKFSELNGSGDQSDEA